MLACSWENRALGCFAIRPASQRWTYSELDPAAEDALCAEDRPLAGKARPKSGVLNTFRMVSMLWLNEGEQLFTGEELW